jgi:uroporphyrinogen-III decarboxylase
MLTKRQNFLETIRGGKPDRFVNQFEYMPLIMGGNPISGAYPMAVKGGPVVKTLYGVLRQWPDNAPAGFPLHDDEHVLIKDITRWKDYVETPKTDYPDSAWEGLIKTVEAVDRKEVFASIMFGGGVFEQCHHTMGMVNALANFYEEPEHVHDLIKFITDYELKFAEQVCKHLKFDLLFHHDDWGTQKSLFISREMFQEFIKPAYMQIYKYYKDHGVEIIVHHCDSYAATLVPDMIDMGVDVFQGCMTTNNVPELVKKYGGKISFMGDLDNGYLDKADWSKDEIRSEVERACKQNGKLYFIPNLVMGLPGSLFPGVYEEVTAQIDRMSKEMF